METSLDIWIPGDTVKEVLCRKCKHLLQFGSSELTSKNKIDVAYLLVAPILLYPFGAVKCTVDELGEIDVRVRKMMHMHLCRFQNVSQL